MLSINEIKDQKWFDSFGTDSFGRHIVYVKDITSAVVNKIPDFIDGKQVLVHFASTKKVDIEEYKNTIPQLEDYSLFLDELTATLDSLVKTYSNSVVTNIFFECHDDEDCVTNFGEKYPTVKDTIKALYDKYGFDNMFEALGLKD